MDSRSEHDSIERAEDELTGFCVLPLMYKVSQSSMSLHKASIEMQPYLAVCKRLRTAVGTCVAGESVSVNQGLTLPLTSTSTLNQTSAPSPFSCSHDTAFAPSSRISPE